MYIVSSSLANMFTTIWQVEKLRRKIVQGQLIKCSANLKLLKFILHLNFFKLLRRILGIELNKK